MATVSFTKDITITDPEAVARFVDLISQPPKPIPEALSELTSEREREKGIELLKHALSR
jgi:hypothetical protein